MRITEIIGKRKKKERKKEGKYLNKQISLEIHLNHSELISW